MKILFLFYVIVCTVNAILNEGTERSNSTQAFGIKGGDRIKIEAQPYTVAINDLNNQFIGNGALISKNWVLTAAINVFGYEAKYITVRLGSEQGTIGGTEVFVAKIVQHPKYKHWSNDLALIKLKSQIKTSSKVKVIKVGRSLPKPGTKLVVSGYGNTEFKFGTDAILRSAIVPFIPYKVCKKYYKHEKDFTRVSLCASKQGVGPCPEDYGDPLVSKGKLIGIYSGSLKDCGSKRNPAVYADVTKYTKWISTTIKQDKLDWNSQ